MGHPSQVKITYRDLKGVSRVLELTLPSVDLAMKWQLSLNAMREGVSAPGGVAHMVWTLSCVKVLIALLVTGH